MPGWLEVTVLVIVIVVLVISLIVFLWRCCFRKQPDQLMPMSMNTTTGTRTRTRTFQDGIAKLHQTSLHHQLNSDTRKRPNYYVFRRSVSTKPLFNWADHPSLITDAVENGWSRFAFAGYVSSSSSTRASIVGICSTGDPGKESEPESSWEVSPGSADFMQKIRLNSGVRKVNNLSHPMAVSSVIKTALPLPGPPFGNSAFPEEAYFEITILSYGSDHESSGKMREDERIKLIHDNSKMNSNSESLVHVSSGNGTNKIEETKLNVKDDVKSESVMVSIGLTAGGSVPLKAPGCYHGSIGFNSNGSVYLDGIKLVFESEKSEWGKADKVIGCGFDPRQKKVFFTVDSELVHVIHCKTEEFSTPLYPTLAANLDITVLVNFGQGVFEYGPANAQRTSNPCFIGPLVNSPAAAAAIGYEDSRELFSMGRIDSQWLNRFMNKGSQNQSNTRMVDYDEDDSDADLFEIPLDSSGRSQTQSYNKPSNV